MFWLKNVCKDIVCVNTLGIVKYIFEISLFTRRETEEIRSLKKLILSVIEKSPEICNNDSCL